MCIYVYMYVCMMSHVSCGVPQGSVLGLKLFILYVNDLCNVSNLVKCILFADDTSLFCSDANINRMFERVSSVLASMCRWFAINKLSLNVLKTSYMLLRNNTAIDTELSINGVCLHCLERVRVAKFLGVLIDEHLNWKPHIARVQSKLSKTTAILYKCSQIIDSCSMRILYCSIFLPYIIVLRYGEIHTTVISTESSLFRKELYGYYLVQADLIILLLFSREQIY